MQNQMQQVGSEAAEAARNEPAGLPNNNNSNDSKSRNQIITLPETASNNERRCYSKKKQEIIIKEEDKVRGMRGASQKRPEGLFGIKMLILGVILIASISKYAACETTIYQNQHQLFKPASSSIGRSLSQVQQNSGKF